MPLARRRFETARNQRRPRRWIGLGAVAAAALAAWLAGAPAALAHTGQPPTPQDLGSAWNLSLAVWAGLALSAWVYGRGWNLLERHRQQLPAWQTACFVAGLVLLFVALVSPLDAAASALFSAHMAQHVLLILGVAPLLALSQPLGPLLLGLPRSWAHWLGGCWAGQGWLRRAGRELSQPLTAGAVQAAVLWGWHAPPVYQAALSQQWVHDAEHLTLLGSALLFWWPALRPATARGGNVAVSFLAIFATGLQSTLLALLIMAAPQPWYSAYTASSGAFGLTPLQDQQLAGALMWAPSAVIYLCAIVALVAGWLRQMDASQRRRQPAWLAAQVGGWER